MKKLVVTLFISSFAFSGISFNKYISYGDYAGNSNYVGNGFGVGFDLYECQYCKELINAKYENGVYFTDECF